MRGSRRSDNTLAAMKMERKFETSIWVVYIKSSINYFVKIEKESSLTDV